MNLNSKDLVYKTQLDSLDLICVCIRKGSETSFMVLERQYYNKEDIEAMNPDEYSVSDLKYNKKDCCYTSDNKSNEEKESNCRLPIKSDCEHRILAQGKFCTVNKTDCQYFKN